MTEIERMAGDRVAGDGTHGRRKFLRRASAIGAAALLPAAVRSAAARGPAKGDIRLGFDNFSIRAFGWKAPRLIEYAASLGVDTLLLSDLGVYESHEEAYLQRIREQAKRAGVELHAGTGSICPTSGSYNSERNGPAVEHARLLIRVARTLGTGVARCYLGSRRDRQGDGGIYRHIEEMVKVCRAVKGEAEDAGVKLAIENHAGDMQAWELVELIEAAGKGHVGATMDSGNAAWTLEHPMVNLEVLGPYAVSAGLRDTAIWETERGAQAMWANMGHGSTDWKAYVARYREICPSCPFVLEIISYKWGHEMAYLDESFWEQFPRARARELARFVALARRGKPFVLPPGRPAGPGSRELEQAQQRWDLEQSLAYCRDVLGLGVKGRS